MTKLGVTPMPPGPRGDLETLLIEYAKANAAVERAIGVRHNAMHAVTEWSEKYARDCIEAENARLLPDYSDSPEQMAARGEAIPPAFAPAEAYLVGAAIKSAPKLLTPAQVAEACAIAAAVTVKGPWVCAATAACERPMGHAGDCIP